MVITEKRTVLVVDDEPVIRENLERLLRGAGYELTVAANGQEALARAQAQEFEVVLLDIKMPGMSGIEVLDQLHARYPDTAVIMVTAMGDVQTAVQAMRSGAYDYILKPPDLDDILVRVEKAIEKRHLLLQVKNYQKNLEERLAQQEKELRALTTQIVQALIKEEVAVRELETSGGKRKGLSAGTDIKDFGSKILRRLSGVQA